MTLYGSYSYGLRNRKDLEILLESPIKHFRFPIRYLRFPIKYKGINAYLGWGYKSASMRTKQYAKDHDRPFHIIEDGFLRSLYNSKLNKTPLSIVLDTKGAYFDASLVTDFEELLVNRSVTDEQKQEAAKGIDFFVKNRLSKYCITTPLSYSNFDISDLKDSIVLLDQTLGDASLEYGGVKADMIPTILEDILKTAGDKKIFLKTHPDVISGKSESCFSSLLEDEKIIKIPYDIPLIDIFAQRPNVVTLTSLAGFEALIHGCQVTCYGLSWYSGYGLTIDKHKEADKIAQRRTSRSLEDIFYLAYIVYPLYLNPNTLQKGTFWDVAYYLSNCIKHVHKMSGTIFAFGFRPWKQKDVLPFFKTPFNQIHYVKTAKEAIERYKMLECKDPKILVWSYKNQGDIDTIHTYKKDIPILRCEDGFIRSYGLGSDFIPPYSLAIDKNNLYFYHSPENPSQIHDLIPTETLPYVKDTVQSLQDSIIKNHINKYNLDMVAPLPIDTPKRKILAIGQVDGDASLKYGLEDNSVTLSNEYLLSYVKETYPDDFIIYKPHPDVVSGNRLSTIENPEDYCHYYAVKESILSCIESADIVVTMTSLSGFEALIRGKQVHILGHPFYKDYNITNSQEKLLDIIRAVFIEYPIYANKSFLDLPYGTALQAIEKILTDKVSWKRNLIVQFKSLKRFYQLTKWIFG